MTSTTTSAATFVKHYLDGLVAAHRDTLDPVDGGVVLRTRKSNHVAVVVGGGSGHYPAFAGMVGPGMGTAAVCGDIFASPSSGQVFRVTEAAESGAGALLLYGNYMGDVLNFSHAQEKLRARGLDVRTVRVTDDVVSAPHPEREKRRGVAGDLFVFKIAGAAAERGDNLDAVEALARRANDNVYTFGVAFGGCTLPGSSTPLFDVPPDTMSIGLGVHGEPGIGEQSLPTAEDLGEILVDRLLDEPRPTESKRITVLLNGLGTMKYEELYGIYGFIEKRLTAEGFEIVRPEVGELVTSLDMNGCSLSIAWLDDELEQLWSAACDAPGFKRIEREGGAGESGQTTLIEATRSETAFVEPARSADYVSVIRSIFDDIAAAVEQAEPELGELDSKTGDGDHGIGMSRGSRGAREAVAASSQEGSVGLISAAAEGWSESGGGTSGAIWGILLGSIATSLSKAPELSTGALAEAITYAAQNVQEIGGARLGDKTLVDALVPFAEKFHELAGSGRGLIAAWNEAAAHATERAQATAQLTAHIGRAKTHAERGVGLPDAGAISLALVARTVGLTLERMEQNT